MIPLNWLAVSMGRPGYYAIVSIMARKNQAAMAMVKARMAKTTPEQRAEIAKNAAAARWEGHVAKRPASSRKKAGKRGNAK